MSAALQNMATTTRHNRILRSLSASVYALEKIGRLSAYQEECALVYYGKKWDPSSELIDINIIEDIEILNYFDYVQPDFFIFEKNDYIINQQDTRIAGYPDLIVEVWSINNLAVEREFKKALYASSDRTEHWYLEQNSNKIQCFLGKKKIEEQNLTEILKTINGITFDLRHLSYLVKH